VAIIQIVSLSAVISAVQWVSVMVGFAWSVLFLVRNLYPVLNRAEVQTSRLLLIGIVAAHAGLAIAVKFVFFRQPPPDDAPDSRFKHLEDLGD
jgi:protein YIPF1/2